MMNPNTLEIIICDNPKEAPNYNEDGKGFKPVNLLKAIIVRNGTAGGNSTVDLQFENEKGERFITMLTGALLKQVTDLL